MKKNKKWSITKKTKLLKIMIYVIASFCTTCVILLNAWLGLPLLLMVGLLAYIVTRPVEVPNLSDLFNGVQYEDKT